MRLPFDLCQQLGWSLSGNYSSSPKVLSQTHRRSSLRDTGVVPCPLEGAASGGHGEPGVASGEAGRGWGGRETGTWWHRCGHALLLRPTSAGRGQPAHWAPQALPGLLLTDPPGALVPQPLSRAPCWPSGTGLGASVRASKHRLLPARLLGAFPVPSVLAAHGGRLGVSR